MPGPPRTLIGRIVPAHHDRLDSIHSTAQEIDLRVVDLLGTISQLSREPNAYKRLDYDARRPY